MPENSPEIFECHIFVDPIYGSERTIRFEADWVAEAEDRIFTLIFWRKRPVTFLRFTDGRHFLVDDHWAGKIKAAQTISSDELNSPQG